MPLPQDNDTSLAKVIGEGVCGPVFYKKNETHEYAIRTLSSVSVNQQLLKNMIQRLDVDSLKNGVTPVDWKKNSDAPDQIITPFLGTYDTVKNQASPETLQHTIEDYPKKSPWLLIKEIAEALAYLHRCHIAHGNLKPGNIFFDSSGKVILSDFAMGNMPDVSFLAFSDALLYSAPEQLRNPHGYLLGKGYKWDTYAFGALAYRLLTGSHPRCSDKFSEIESKLQENPNTSISYSTEDIANLIEKEKIAPWPSKPANKKESELRGIIERCLSLEPETRCYDLNQVMHLWEKIDTQQATSNTERKNKIAYTAACMTTLSALCLGGMLLSANSKHADARQGQQKNLQSLTEEKALALQEKSKALEAKNTIEAREQNILKQSANSKQDLEEQLIELGAVNDNIIAWVMRTQNTNLPELTTASPRQEFIAQELDKFIKTIEGKEEFSPLKARIMMQLVELKLLSKQPHEADLLLDQALTLWKQENIEDESRIARARLVCLLQSLDLNNPDLTESLLPKARQDIASLTAGGDIEARRINAVMEIINGRIAQGQNPKKALEHFELALKDLQGIHDQLPEHVIIRSELAEHTLTSSEIADSLQRVDHAARLRSEAAIHLQWLLEKNPSLQFAKVKLAEINILSAEESMRSGNEHSGVKQLTKAENLLKGLSTNDTEINGAAFQLAVASGLSSVILRDRGRLTDASNNLDRSIRIMEKIVDAHPSEPEPLYRLAMFNWQRAGLAGSKGDKKTELKQGEIAAKLIEQLLTLNSEKRDIEARRALAYLYGNLGTIAGLLEKPATASSHYRNASKMWKSLIKINGHKEEYNEGLKWSQARH